MKQIERVLDAVNKGARTTYEVESVTGLNRNSISSYLAQLQKMGCIEIVGRFVLMYTRLGRPCHIYKSIDRGEV